MTELFTTQVMYQVNYPIKIYEEERKTLHQLIIKRKTANSESKEPASAVLTAGGSGAGKSFFVEEYFLKSEDEEYVLIDSDNIKEELPEYVELIAQGNLDAADIVHGESGDIADLLLNFCIENQYSFIYDGTMSKYEKYVDLIAKLRDHNFSVAGLYVDIDVEVALERARVRAANTGRAVPEKVIRETNAKSAPTFHSLYKKMDYALWFNNSKTDKERKLIPPFAEYSGGIFTPHNPAQYKIYKKKLL